MLSKKIAIAAIAGASLLAASGVHARDHRYDNYRGHDRHSNYDRHSKYDRHDYDRHQHRHGPPRHVVHHAVPYYVPAPVYYAPAPVYNNAPSRPVLSGQIPIGNNRNINIEFAL